MTDAATPDWAREVLDFWFGPEAVARPEWFRKDEAFDDTIRTRFGDLLERALAGSWPGGGAATAPAARPRTALARIVVLDQFTRNAFRGTARSFAGDAGALAEAQALVARGEDRTLGPWQRVFAYLPYEHAESLALQDEAMRLFGRLAEDAPETAGNLEWARKHHAVVERFGRFPHRNEILGRASTPDEQVFLGEPGSRF